MGPIVIIAELEGGSVRSASYEAVEAGRALSRMEGGSLLILAPGNNVRGAADELASRTGIDVLALENEDAEAYSAGLWKSMLAEAVGPLGPRFVIVPHTARGYDFAPGLAVRLGAACITAVEAVGGSEGRITLTRSAFGGKLSMDIAPPKGTVVLTVQPGAFPARDTESASPGKVSTKRTGAIDSRYRPLGIRAVEGETASLNEAEVVVAAGRGVGKKENMGLITELASLFSRSVVAGSRAACDAGWLPYARQVGVTGKTVAPRLYIACGISGTAQHVSGMKGSQTIVAINTDPGAPIFNIAHVGVVEDLAVFIPLLTEARLNIKLLRN